MFTLAILISVAFAIALISFAFRARKPLRQWFANIAEGQWLDGKKTYLADAAITTRFLIVKGGTDLDHIAICTAASDDMIGICTDEPTAAESPTSVSLVGASPGTGKVSLGGTVAIYGLITSDGSGKGVAASSGNRIIGKALRAGVSGDVIPFLWAAPNQTMA